MHVVYDYYVEELVPCLAAEGYRVGHVPTWEEFWEDPFGPDMWNPYSALDPEASLRERDRLMEECPPNPPPERLSDYRS
jgi:hypothetical protein